LPSSIAVVDCRHRCRHRLPSSLSSSIAVVVVVVDCRRWQSLLSSSIAVVVNVVNCCCRLFVCGHDLQTVIRSEKSACILIKTL
jgi:hypothetical protein